VISSWEYGYDDVGNVTSQTDKDSLVASYTFDDIYRLTAVDYPSGSDFGYEYDAVGNRTKMFEYTSSTITTTYTYDNADELTQWTTSTVTMTFTYASDGSLKTKSDGTDTWTYEWDFERRLNAFKKNSATLVEYTFNPTGARRQASDSTLGLTNYFHAGLQVLGEYNSNWSLVTSYILGANAMLDRTTDPDTVHYLTRDRLDSTRELVNSSETVNTRYAYDSWGDPAETQLSGSVSSSYLFCGAEYDKTSMAHNFGSRQYADTLGGFSSRNPMFEGARKHVKRYVYAANNPVTASEPYWPFFLGGLLLFDYCSDYDHDECMACCNARKHSCYNQCNKLDRYFFVVTLLLPRGWGIPLTLFDARYPTLSTCRRFCDYWWGENCEDDCPPPPFQEIQECPAHDYYCCDESNYTSKPECCPYGRSCTACREHCGYDETPCDNDSGDPWLDDHGCGQWFKCENGYDGGKWKWVGTTGDAWDPNDPNNRCGP